MLNNSERHCVVRGLSAHCTPGMRGSSSCRPTAPGVWNRFPSRISATVSSCIRGIGHAHGHRGPRPVPSRGWKFFVFRSPKSCMTMRPAMSAVSRSRTPRRSRTTPIPTLHAALHLNHHALQIVGERAIGGGNVEVEPPINPPVRRPPGGHEAIHLLDGPLLEVVLVPLPDDRARPPRCAGHLGS